MFLSKEEHLLQEFVDRTNEMHRFCEMLETDEKPIMVVWGETGIGKSTLLAKMKHECALRKLRKAAMQFKDIRSNHYIEIMRQIREDLGGDCFNSFTDLLNYYYDNDGTYRPKFDINITAKGSVSILDKGTIGNSTTGDIAGTMLKDNMIVIPRRDIDVPEAERMARLTDRFIDGLNETAATGQIIVFIDAVEKLSPDTEKWIWEELLDTVRQGKLSNVKFVICGQSPPAFDHEWRFFVTEAELRPLGLEHIKAYLSKKGIEEPGSTDVALTLLATTKGKIRDIAKGVDVLLDLKKQMGLTNE